MRLRTVARAAAVLVGSAAAAETLRGAPDNDRGDLLHQENDHPHRTNNDGTNNDGERNLRDPNRPHRIFTSGVDPEMRDPEYVSYVPPEDRIIGGQQAREGECPSCVSMSDKWGHFCGGSLIVPNIVLTAAHCLGGMSFDVIAGRTNLNNQNDGRAIPVKTELGHPDYDSSTTDNDFALLLLEDSFDIGGNIGLVEINSSPRIPDVGNQVTVMGWGDTNPSSYESDLSDKLMKVSVDMISNTDCGRSEGTTSDGMDDTYKGQITDNMMCARVSGGGKDACQGDSGGPLFVDTNAGTVQVGVVSWGVGCAEKDFPGVYARVSRVYPWIRDYVCKHGDRPPRSFGCGGSVTVIDAGISGASENGGSDNGSISLPGLDPDNNDAAPSPTAPSPTPNNGRWKSVLSEGFENGIGNKFTGGQDTRYFKEAKYRSGIMRLQLGLPGEAERASIVSESIDVANYNKCRVVMSVMFIGMEPNDRFCAEYSTDGGPWSGAGCWAGDDRTNKRWYDGETAEFGVEGAGTARVRLRCRANNRKDDVLVDECEVECQ